jgi:hypothetical protein
MDSPVPVCSLRRLRLLLLAAVWLTPAPADVPQMIHYQGRVAVDGVNFDGTGQFKFALVDGGTVVSPTLRQATAALIVDHGRITGVTILDGGAGYVRRPRVMVESKDGTGASLFSELAGYAVGAIHVMDGGALYNAEDAVIIDPPTAQPYTVYQTYWSNDGTSNGGTQPTNAVPLSVTKGLYAALLGDTTLANMSTLSPGALGHAEVRLRVWFSDGTTGFQQLSPDQRLGAVAYAIIAGTVPAGAIGGNEIAEGAVSSSQLAAGAVHASHVSAGAVGSAQLAVGAVLGNHVSAGAIGTTQLAAQSVGNAQIAPDAVQAAQIAAGAVGASELGSGSVQSTHVATGAIGSTQLGSGAVTTAKIATGAVGSAQIATGAVGNDALGATVVTANKIANSAVGANQIATGSVGATHLVAGAVGTTQLAATAVTADKIATGAVGSTQILDASVATTDLDMTALDARYLNTAGDTATGNLNMGAFRLTNLGTPTATADAATKGYVDTAGLVPVGAILPWTKNLTGVPALQASFVECNGQTLSDAASPLNGQVIPNLNGSGGSAQRFLRGATVSGATGGTETHTHTGNGTTSWAGEGSGHNESMDSCTIGGCVIVTDFDHHHAYSFTSNTTATVPSYYEVVWIMRVK